MFKAFVLVRNLVSSAESLDFGEFTIALVGLRFQELREVFSSRDVNPADWIFEKSYPELPPSTLDLPLRGIQKDVEDILLLLRLLKVGDIAFVRQATTLPSGDTFIEPPYRAMNDVNGRPDLKFNVEPEDCQAWGPFADGIRNSQSWSSDWFATARRSFLCGGAKQFNLSPEWEDVDRILDYAVALEATLVPDGDYVKRRVSRRAAALLASESPAEIVAFTKRFYEIRSRIAHGSTLGDKNRQWLLQNSGQVEERVRELLRTAVQKLPPSEEDRKVALERLYDLTDEDRGSLVLQKFNEVKNVAIRKAIAAKISQLARE